MPNLLKTNLTINIELSWTRWGEGDVSVARPTRRLPVLIGSPHCLSTSREPRRGDEFRRRIDIEASSEDDRVASSFIPRQKAFAVSFSFSLF